MKSYNAEMLEWDAVQTPTVNCNLNGITYMEKTSFLGNLEQEK